MGRFFNREAGMVAAGIAIAALAVGLVAGLKPWAIAIAVVGSVGILHWPVTLWVQDWLIERWVAQRRFDKALHLAIAIRDSALVRAERIKATIDVALIHISRGDYENAVQNLRKVIPNQTKPVMRAVIEGNMGYCLAHLGRDLDQAEEYIRTSIQNAPQEPLFEYFQGLLRLKQGRAAEARDLILKSLEREPDLDLPAPGERAWALAQALKVLGDQNGAKVQLEKAKGRPSRFGEMAQTELSA